MMGMLQANDVLKNGLGNGRIILRNISLHTCSITSSKKFEFSKTQTAIIDKFIFSNKYLKDTNSSIECLFPLLLWEQINNPSIALFLDVRI
jgi:hypothetical protein